MKSPPKINDFKTENLIEIDFHNHMVNHENSYQRNKVQSITTCNFDTPARSDGMTKRETF